MKLKRSDSETQQIDRKGKPFTARTRAMSLTCDQCGHVTSGQCHVDVELARRSGDAEQFITSENLSFEGALMRSFDEHECATN